MSNAECSLKVILCGLLGVNISNIITCEGRCERADTYIKEVELHSTLLTPLLSIGAGTYNVL